jgi:[ribosomal protein S18]-alanine N-acetyltransferase
MIGVNPSTSLRAGLQVRPAVPDDLQRIADLIFFETRIHRHLDWRTPLEWLGHSPYWVLEENRRVVAALACPPDPPSISWIRLFALASDLPGPAAWSLLWDAARGELAGGGVTAAAIVTQPWFESILVRDGFSLPQHIVLLEWSDRPAATQALIPGGVIVRRMAPADLQQVVHVDAEAFVPLWHNSLEALNKAYSQAVHASVAEDASGLLGYQLSTESRLGVHLARLAVRPEAQGRGIGSALVSDLVAFARARGFGRLTVNTQQDNSASLALYQRLGFRRTGEEYPVYTYRVE